MAGIGCNKCEYYKEKGYSDKCTHGVASTVFNAVTGEVYYKSCMEMRKSESFCGINAILFKPHLTKFQKFDKMFDEFFDKLIIKVKRLL
jgi:hypothetical protein